MIGERMVEANSVPNLLLRLSIEMRAVPIKKGMVVYPARSAFQKIRRARSSHRQTIARTI